MRNAKVQLTLGWKSTQSRTVQQRKNKVKKTVGLSFAFLLNLAYCLSSSDGQKSFLLEKVGNQNKQTWEKKQSHILFWLNTALLMFHSNSWCENVFWPTQMNIPEFTEVCFQVVFIYLTFSVSSSSHPSSAAIKLHTLKLKYGIKLILTNNPNDFPMNHKGWGRFVPLTLCVWWWSLRSLAAWSEQEATPQSDLGEAGAEDCQGCCLWSYCKCPGCSIYLDGIEMQ